LHPLILKKSVNKFCIYYSYLYFIFKRLEWKKRNPTCIERLPLSHVFTFC